MEIGVTGHAYGLYFGENRYKKMKEHGFSCIDFDMESVLSSTAPDKLEAVLLHEKALAEKSGIKLWQVHGPWRFPPRDTTVEERAERMERMKQSIRMTAKLGCHNWVIHPLFPFGMQDAGTDDAQKTWEVNLDFMKTLLKTAHDADVTICFENMPFINFSIARPEQTQAFVREINDDYFKMCLDTGHVAVFKDLNVGDELRRVKDEVRVLHVHDNRNGLDLHMFPYFGTIDWADFKKALQDIHFQGVLSLETMPPSNLPRDIFEKLCIALADIAKTLVD